MSGIEPSEYGDCLAVELHNRVIGRLHGAGLTLAGVLGFGALDRYVAEQLRGVINELDSAARDLRDAGPDPAHRLTMIDPARPARVDERRYLCKCEDGQVFAYATPTGHDFFRAIDHTPWAHESGELLLSARSGTPLARRVGSVFHDIAADTALYYERGD